MRLFSKQGFHSVSVSQIAKEAGVSKGLIYNYFSSKEELLEAVMIDLMHVKQDLMEEAMKFDKPLDELRFFLDQYFAFVENKLSLMKMILPLAMQEEPIAIVRRLFQGQIDGFVAHTRSMFEALGYQDPEAEVWTLNALLNGITLGLITMSGDYPFDLIKSHVYKQYKL